MSQRCKNKFSLKISWIYDFPYAVLYDLGSRISSNLYVIQIQIRKFRKSHKIKEKRNGNLVVYKWFVKGANLCSFELCRTCSFQTPFLTWPPEVPLESLYEISRHLLLGMGFTRAHWNSLWKSLHYFAIVILMRHWNPLSFYLFEFQLKGLTH